MAHEPEKKQSSSYQLTRAAEVWKLSLRGRWTIEERRPSLESIIGDGRLPSGGLTVDCSEVESWDSRLLILLIEARERGRRDERSIAFYGLAEGLRRFLEEIPEGTESAAPEEALPSGQRGERTKAFLAKIGEGTLDNLAFTGETVRGFLRSVKRPGKFRWGDTFEAMQQTGAKALPIVGLISFLVGLIMAYQGGVQLRRFGADIFVADLVGLAVVREMGPMMAAVVLAGRTGAAFAAQIGAMKVNEEVDALETLGLKPVDFLVLPRMLALVLMMPLLAIYANFLGIIGGLVVGVTAMDMTPVTYWSRTQEAILMRDVFSGLIKSVAFGVLIAYSGCLRGMQCQRSSAGVGAAATSAVVTGILLVIVVDALFAVIFNLVGL